MNQILVTKINQKDKTKKLLTLVTCNNRNSNRIIVRAEQNL